MNVSGVKVYRTEQSVFRDQWSIEILDIDSSKKEPFTQCLKLLEMYRQS